MPKLRYKKEKKRHHDHDKSKKKKHKKRGDYHVPQAAYEPEEGWVPPNAHDPWDEEEAEWRAKMFDAMGEDEGGDGYFSRYEYHQPQEQRMSDEEYRQHIVRGMYERKHAAEIEAERIWKAEQDKKRREREEARRKVMEEEAERRRIEEMYRQMERERRYQTTIEEYDKKWKDLEELSEIKRKDIPWPIQGRSFSFDSVRSFFMNNSKESTNDLKKRVRQEQRRYHPDKFMTRVMSRFKGSENDKQQIMTHMNEIAGWLNELWQKL
ncbi:hypothetical protein CU097_005073 [Rhizopus azygosporus]|uniref:J domain-containing protein n=1 Tax=Rhizopus azygosporus TaxID=86630 RepID=A0A367IX51_RHIAZ|nr:hypothetical protein CU097_005073 [Rhizopus azygosporus]